MKKLTVFNFVSLDGYYDGPKKGDISWHVHGPEETEYSIEMLKLNHTLLFGRVTYELMASYWPTASVKENDPIVANAMNQAEKIVFSKTLKKAMWNNTRIIHKKMEKAIRDLKEQPGKDLTILGSGSIVSQLAQEGLIDEYEIMVNPVVLGKGRSMFKSIGDKINMKLTNTKVFQSGSVLLCYQPAIIKS